MQVFTCQQNLLDPFSLYIGERIVFHCIGNLVKDEKEISDQSREQFKFCMQYRLPTSKLVLLVYLIGKCRQITLSRAFYEKRCLILKPRTTFQCTNQMQNQTQWRLVGNVFSRLIMALVSCICVLIGYWFIVSFTFAVIG